MNRSGSALYLVLLGIAAISVGTVTISESAISTIRVKALAQSDLQCETLRADAVLATARILADLGETVRTPPDAPWTALRVVDTRTMHGSTPVHLIVDAWDASSGIPCTRGHDLGHAPADVIPPTAASDAAWWLIAEWPGHPRFPMTDEPADSPPALAIAMAAYGADRVNWRTAPWPLVETILARAGQSALEPKLAAARLNDTPVEWPDDWIQNDPPYLVSSTDRWCLLVHIRLGEHRRTWLEVVAGKPVPQTLMRYEIH